MPFVDANSELAPLLFQMKQYKNLTKSTIEILPSSGQTSYGPNQKCIFTLPYASLISLEDLALHFNFVGHNIPTTATDGLNSLRIVAPKDVASLIAEIDIKINGQTIQHLTRYNDIVNLLNLFEDGKTSKKVLQGFEPKKYSYKTTAGQYTTVDSTNYISAPNANNVERKYVINNWYGLLGHRGDEVSSNFIDTNMLGEVTIAFTFASAATCISHKQTSGVEAKKTNTSVTTADSTVDTELAAAHGKDNSNYKLTDLKMSMVRYNLPMEYSEALRSNLSSGAKYQIAFNHYEIHSQLAGKNSGTIRWNENSRDIKGLLAFFSASDRDNSTVPSEFSEPVETSKYFRYDNPIHNNSQFQIGSVKMPQNVLDSTDCFLELKRAVEGVKGKNIEFFHKVTTVEQWIDSYFIAYLSLEMTEGMDAIANGGKKLLSGLSSEQLPIACSYTYNNDSGTFATGYAWNKNVNVMTLSTRMLVVQSGQNCYLEI
jgi:hypothetical protein